MILKRAAEIVVTTLKASKMKSPMLNSQKLILASASQGRAWVLKQAGIDFIVDAADLDEEAFHAPTTAELVLILAKAKAEVVAARHRDGFLVAVDTLVVLDDQIIGKPKDAVDAAAMLARLSGRTHRVISGIVVYDLTTKKVAQDVVMSDVTFKPLTASIIADYIATGEFWGKAGSYSSQERGKDLIAKIDGDFTNVVGLPLQSFMRLLQKLANAKN